MLVSDYTYRLHAAAAWQDDSIFDAPGRNRMPCRTFRLILLWLLAGWQFAWADPPPAEAPAAPTDVLQQLKSAPSRGLLYEVSRDGKIAYLFGTIHVGRPDFFPLDLVVTQALAHSSELVVELDATQGDKMQAAMQRHAVLPDSQRLDSLLSPTLRKRLQTQLDALRIPRDALQAYKPWMASLSLMMGAMQASGFEPAYATDLYLIALARGLDKPIDELESIDYQLELFDSTTRQEQLAFLDETLQMLEQGRLRGDTQALVDAWLDSDAQALQQQSLASMRESPRSARWMQQKLFTERNLHMAASIDRMLAAGRQPFVAIGALHLTGADGVPALLAMRGYRIKNLYP
jgi:hypothetical protein